MYDLSYSLYFVDSPLNKKGYVKSKIYLCNEIV